ncbi:uncharacterized protein LOC115034206 [Acyrthosiphon pisum]|uniref:HAT C-terminal dimerisation domain-containing protein n=1 Tax=Acyrthosiphon pisum TaxID=7029 RepID=A0A8R2NUB3_ACYPI|nr:uncharacterized protein LOC115034206 [Acyrthosiphon pisum]
MYLRIFKKTTPLSKYLQGHGVNIIAAYQMVKQTLNDLQDCARQFQCIKEAANTFVEYTNKKFDEMENNTLEILNELPHIRVRKKKRQFTDYESIDDPITDPLRAFEINVYNQVFDTVIESISSRFEKHEQLCADFSCLDPNNFQLDLPLPTNALIKIYEKIRNFIPDITYDDLRNEYVDFTSKWRELKKTIACVYDELNNQVTDDGDDSENGLKSDDDIIVCVHSASTKYCVTCCYEVLVKYNLYANTYRGLHFAYKFMLTLSITQVESERTFSKLKFVKNYLRNTIGQNVLESMLLMNVEKDILNKIDSEDIINKLGARSPVFGRMLLC